MRRTKVVALPRAQKEADHVYALWRRGQRVAEFRHDASGKAPAIRIDAEWLPIRQSILDDGDPKPYRISEEGELILDEVLARK